MAIEPPGTTLSDVADANPPVTSPPVSTPTKPNYIGTDYGIADIFLPDVIAGVQYTATPTRFDARYVSGDEWVSIASMTPIVRQGLVDAMKAAGFLTRDHDGAPDSTLASAMREVMSVANGSGRTWQDVVKHELSAKEQTAPAADPPPASGGRSVTYQVSNPDTLAAVARKVAASFIGRRVDDEFVGRFVDSYQQAERDRQRRLAFGAGEVVDTVDAGVLVENMLRDSHGTEMAATGIANTFNTFAELLGGVT